MSATSTEQPLAHESSPRTYWLIYAWLMALMILTIIAARINLGGANVLVALVIAAVKATLVVLLFMHVKYAGRVVWVFAGASFLWLGIMVALTMSDYVSRTWVPRQLADQPAAAILRSRWAPGEYPRPMTDLTGRISVRAPVLAEPASRPAHE
jgi:cytochrome c oxidase subunit 4